MTKHRTDAVVERVIAVAKSHGADLPADLTDLRVSLKHRMVCFISWRLVCQDCETCRDPPMGPHTPDDHLDEDT